MPSSSDLLAAQLARTGEPVARYETHISTVLFQGEWAYKVKRPVRFEFIDLSTAELREGLCRRELHLNRRFAPDVYDSVIEIRDPDGRLVDHALKMRRMPEDRRLATLARNHDPDAGKCVVRVARAIAAAHAVAPRSAEIDRTGEPAFVERLWQRSIDDLRRFSPEVIDGDILQEIDERARSFVRGRSKLFAARVHGRSIVDGHGDLLADDIFCLPDGPRILDCLEFDDQLRFGDVLLDIAFLAMELEHLGRADMAEAFVGAYEEHSGEHFPASLLHFFIAYRALVRAKVTCFKIADHLESRGEAVSLIDLTVRNLRKAGVAVTIVGGLPASGKTTIAGHLADLQGAVLLRTDVIRKELTGLAGLPAESAFNTGIYAAPTTELTYAEAFRRAKVAVGLGESVIIDASFTSQRWRDAARELADETLSAFREIRCVCPGPVREARLAGRPHDGSEPSDANTAISAEMERLTDDWPSATDVDTNQPLEDSLAQIERAEPSVAASVVWERPGFEP